LSTPAGDFLSRSPSGLSHQGSAGSAELGLRFQGFAAGLTTGIRWQDGSLADKRVAAGAAKLCQCRIKSPARWAIDALSCFYLAGAAVGGAKQLCGGPRTGGFLGYRGTGPDDDGLRRPVEPTTMRIVPSIPIRNPIPGCDFPRNPQSKSGRINRPAPRVRSALPHRPAAETPVTLFKLGADTTNLKILPRGGGGGGVNPAIGGGSHPLGHLRS
jgi:hypothetical protein